MDSERVIVIGGGVGPMAGVALHERIIENTLTDGRDQSHLDVYHFSRSRDIPDRTAYLLGESQEDPAEGMFRSFQAAFAALEILGAKGVGGVPCNTFHAPAIYDRFIRRLRDERIDIPVLNMLEETVSLIKSMLPGAGRIGLLSTTGTRRSQVYDRLLARAALEPVYVPVEDQPVLHEAIYEPSWGLKAKSPASPRAVETVSAMAGRLMDAGAEAIVLACTELPLALDGRVFRGLPLVDPMRALARALIREAAPEKLKPLRL